MIKNEEKVKELFELSILRDSVKEFKKIAKESPDFFKNQIEHPDFNIGLCVTGKNNILKYILDNSLFKAPKNILNTLLKMYKEESNEEVRERYIKTIKLLFDNGFYINDKGEYDWMFLFNNARESSIDLGIGFQKHLEHLVKNLGIDLNKENEKGVSPFVEACHSGSLSIVKDMVKMGADVNKVYKNRLTPLSHAAYTSNLELIQFLIDSGADVNYPGEYSALSIATFQANLEVVTLLLQNGAEFTTGDPLNYACANKDTDILKYFEKYGVDPNMLNEDGSLPVETILDNKDYQTLGYLLQLGLNIKVRNINGSSALDLAIQNNDAGFFMEIEHIKKIEGCVMSSSVDDIAYVKTYNIGF